MAGKRSAVARMGSKIRSMVERSRTKEKGGPGTQQTTHRPASCTGEVKNQYQEKIANIAGHVRGGNMVEAYRAIRYTVSAKADNIFKSVFDGTVASTPKATKTPEQQAARELAGIDFETKIKAPTTSGGGGQDTTPPPEDDDQKNWGNRISDTISRMRNTAPEELLRNTNLGEEGTIFQAGYIRAVNAIQDTLEGISYMSGSPNEHLEGVRDLARSLIRDLAVAEFKLNAKYGEDFADVFHAYSKSFQQAANRVLDFVSNANITGASVTDNLPDHILQAWNDLDQLENTIADVLYAQDSAVRNYQATLGTTHEQTAISALSGKALTRTFLSNPKIPALVKEDFATRVGTPILATAVRELSRADVSQNTQDSTVDVLSSDPPPENSPMQVAERSDSFTRESETNVAAIKRAATESGSLQNERLADTVTEFPNNLYSAVTNALSTFTTQLGVLDKVLSASAKLEADNIIAERNKETDVMVPFSPEARKQLQDIEDQTIGMSLDLFIGDNIKDIVDLTHLDVLGSMPHHTTKNFVNDPNKAVSEGSILDVQLRSLESQLHRKEDGSVDLSTDEGIRAHQEYSAAMSIVDELNKFRAHRDSLMLPQDIKIDFSPEFKQKNPTLTPKKAVIKAASDTAELHNLRRQRDELRQSIGEDNHNAGVEHSKLLSNLESSLSTFKDKIWSNHPEIDELRTLRSKLSTIDSSTEAGNREAKTVQDQIDKIESNFNPEFKNMERSLKKEQRSLDPEKDAGRLDEISQRLNVLSTLTSDPAQQLDHIIDDNGSLIRTIEHVQNMKNDLNRQNNNDRRLSLSPETQKSIISSLPSSPESVTGLISELKQLHIEGVVSINKSVDEHAKIERQEQVFRDSIADISEEISAIRKLINTSRLTEDRRVQLETELDSKTTLLNQATASLKSLSNDKYRVKEQVDHVLKSEQFLRDRIAQAGFESLAIRNKVTAGDVTVRLKNDEVITSTDNFFNNLAQVNVLGDSGLNHLSTLQNRQKAERDIAEGEKEISNITQRIKIREDIFHKTVPQGSNLSGELSKLSGMVKKVTKIASDVTPDTKAYAILNNTITSKEKDLAVLNHELQPYNKMLEDYRKVNAPDPGSLNTLLHRTLDGMGKSLIIAGRDSWVRRMVQDNANDHYDTLVSASKDFFNKMTTSYAESDAYAGSDERQGLRTDFHRNLSSNAYSQSVKARNIRGLLEQAAAIPGQGGTGRNSVYDSQAAQDIAKQTRLIIRSFRDINDSGLTPDQISATSLARSRVEIKEGQKSDVDLSHFYGLQRSKTDFYNDPQSFNRLVTTGAFSTKKGDAMSPQALKEVTSLMRKLKNQVSDVTSLNSSTRTYTGDSDANLIKAMKNLETLLRNQDTMAEVTTVLVNDTTRSFDKLDRALSTKISPTINNLRVTSADLGNLVPAINHPAASELHRLVDRLISKVDTEDTTYGYGAKTNSRMMRDLSTLGQIQRLTNTIVRSNLDRADATSDDLAKTIKLKKQFSEKIDELMIDVARLNLIVDDALTPANSSLSRNILERYTKPVIKDTLAKLNQDPGFQAVYKATKTPDGKVIRDINDLQVAYRDNLPSMMRSGNFDAINREISRSIETRFGKERGEEINSWLNGTHDFHQKTGKNKESQADILRAMTNHRAQRELVSLSNGDTDTVLMHPASAEGVKISLSRGGGLDSTYGKTPDRSLLDSRQVSSQDAKIEAKNTLDRINRNIDSVTKQIDEIPKKIQDFEVQRKDELSKEADPDRQKEINSRYDQIIKRWEDNRVTAEQDLQRMNEDATALNSFMNKIPSYSDDTLSSNFSAVARNLQSNVGKNAFSDFQRKSSRTNDLKVSRFEENVYALSGNSLKLIKNTHEDEGIRKAAGSLESSRKELFNLRNELSGLSAKTHSLRIKTIRDRMDEIRRDMNEPLTLMRDHFNTTDRQTNLVKLASRIIGDNDLTPESLKNLHNSLNDTLSLMNDIKNRADRNENITKLVDELSGLDLTLTKVGIDNNRDHQEVVVDLHDTVISEIAQKRADESLETLFLRTQIALRNAISKDKAAQGEDTEKIIRDAQDTLSSELKDTIVKILKDNGMDDDVKIEELSRHITNDLLTVKNDSSELNALTQGFLKVYGKTDEALESKLLNKMTERERQALTDQLKSIPSDRKIRKDAENDPNLTPRDVADLIAKAKQDRDAIKRDIDSLESRILESWLTQPESLDNLTAALRRIGLSENDLQDFSRIYEGEVSLGDDPRNSILNSLRKLDNLINERNTNEVSRLLGDVNFVPPTVSHRELFNFLNKNSRSIDKTADVENRSALERMVGRVSELQKSRMSDDGLLDSSATLLEKQSIQTDGKSLLRNDLDKVDTLVDNLRTVYDKVDDVDDPIYQLLQKITTEKKTLENNRNLLSEISAITGEITRGIGLHYDETVASHNHMIGMSNERPQVVLRAQAEGMLEKGWIKDESFFSTEQFDNFFKQQQYSAKQKALYAKKGADELRVRVIPESITSPFSKNKMDAERQDTLTFLDRSKELLDIARDLAGQPDSPLDRHLLRKFEESQQKIMNLLKIRDELGNRTEYAEKVYSVTDRETNTTRLINESQLDAFFPAETRSRMDIIEHNRIPTDRKTKYQKDADKLIRDIKTQEFLIKEELSNYQVLRAELVSAVIRSNSVDNLSYLKQDLNQTRLSDLSNNSKNIMAGVGVILRRITDRIGANPDRDAIQRKILQDVLRNLDDLTDTLAQRMVATNDTVRVLNENGEWVDTTQATHMRNKYGDLSGLLIDNSSPTLILKRINDVFKENSDRVLLANLVNLAFSDPNGAMLSNLDRILRDQDALFRDQAVISDVDGTRAFDQQMKHFPELLDQLKNVMSREVDQAETVKLLSETDLPSNDSKISNKELLKDISDKLDDLDTLRDKDKEDYTKTLEEVKKLVDTLDINSKTGENSHTLVALLKDLGDDISWSSLQSKLTGLNNVEDLVRIGFSKEIATTVLQDDRFNDFSANVQIKRNIDDEDIVLFASEIANNNENFEDYKGAIAYLSTLSREDQERLKTIESLSQEEINKDQVIQNFFNIIRNDPATEKVLDVIIDEKRVLKKGPDGEEETFEYKTFGDFLRDFAKDDSGNIFNVFNRYNREGKIDSLSEVIKSNPKDVLAAIKKLAQTRDYAAETMIQTLGHEAANRYHGIERETLVKALTDVETLLSLRLDENIVIGVLQTASEKTGMKVTPEARMIVEGLIAASDMHDQVVQRLSDPLLSLQFAENRNDHTKQGEDIISELHQSLNQLERETLQDANPGLVVKDHEKYNIIKEKVDSILKEKDEQGMHRSLDESINKILSEVNPDKNDYPAFVAVLMDTIQNRLQGLPILTEQSVAEGSVQDAVADCLVDMACATSALNSASVVPSVSVNKGTTPNDTRTLAVTTHQMGDSGYAVTIHDSQGGVEHYMLSTSFESAKNEHRDLGIDVDGAIGVPVKTARDLADLMDSIADKTQSGEVILTAIGSNLKDDMALWAKYADSYSAHQLTKHVNNESDLTSHESTLSLRAGMSDGTPEASDNSLLNVLSIHDKLSDYLTELDELPGLYKDLFNEMTNSANKRMNVQSHDDYKEQVQSGAWFGKPGQNASVSDAESNFLSPQKSRNTIRDEVKRTNSLEPLAHMLREGIASLNTAINEAGRRIVGADDRTLAEKDSASLLINQSIGDLNFQSSKFQSGTVELSANRLANPLSYRTPDKLLKVNEAFGTREYDYTVKKLNNMVENYYRVMKAPVPISMRNVTSLPKNFVDHMRSTLKSHIQAYDGGAENLLANRRTLESINREYQTNPSLAGQDPIAAAVNQGIDRSKVKLNREWQPNMRQKLQRAIADNGSHSSLAAINKNPHLKEAVHEILAKVDPSNAPTRDKDITAKDLSRNKVAIQRVLAQQVLTQFHNVDRITERIQDKGSSENFTITNNDRGFLEEHFTKALSVVNEASNKTVIDIDNSVPDRKTSKGKIYQKEFYTESPNRTTDGGNSESVRRINDAIATLKEHFKDLVSEEMTPERLMKMFESKEHIDSVVEKGSVHEAFQSLIKESQMKTREDLKNDLNTLMSAQGRTSVFNDTLNRWKSDGLISDDAFRYIHSIGVDKYDISRILSDIENDSERAKIAEQVEFLTSFQNSINHLPNQKWGNDGYDTIALHNNHATVSDMVHSMNYESRLNYQDNPQKSLRVIRESARLMDTADKLSQGATRDMYAPVARANSYVKKSLERNPSGEVADLPAPYIFSSVSDAEISRMVENAKFLPEPIKKLINTFVSEARKVSKGLSDVTINRDQNNALMTDVLNPISQLHVTLSSVMSEGVSDRSETHQVLSQMSSDDKLDLRRSIEVMGQIGSEINRYVHQASRNGNEPVAVDSARYGKLIDSFNHMVSLLPQSVGNPINEKFQSVIATIKEPSKGSVKLSANQAQTMIAVRQLYGGPSLLSGNTVEASSKVLGEALNNISLVQSLIFDKMRGVSTEELSRINKEREAKGQEPLRPDDRLTKLLARINNQNNDPDGRTPLKNRSLSPQEHLMIRGLLSKDRDIHAALQAAKDSLRILGADSSTVGRKQRLNNLWDSTPDSLALQANPMVRIVDELSNALYALEAHFDTAHIVNQIQDEINNIPQSQMITELNTRFGETFSKYRLNPAAPVVQPTKNLDTNEIDHQQHAYDMEKLTSILHDLINISPSGSGATTRHDFNMLIATVDGVKEILTLTSNLPSILQNVSDVNNPSHEDSLMELDAMMSQIGSLSSLIAPPVSARARTSTMKQATMVSMDNDPYNQYSDDSPISNETLYDTTLQLDGGDAEGNRKEDLSKGELKSISNISSPVVRAVERKDEFIKAVGNKSFGSPMQRLTRLGSLLNGLKNETQMIATDIVRPFLEGSGKVASTVGMFKSWQSARNKNPEFRKRADSVMKLQLIKTYGAERTKNIRTAIDKSGGDTQSVLEALWDNGFKGIVHEMIIPERSNPNGRFIKTGSEKGKDVGYVERTFTLKNAKDFTIDQHMTNLAADSVFSYVMLNNLPDTHNEGFRTSFTQTSSRLLNILSRNTPSDQTTAPLVYERKMEYSMLMDIIEQSKLMPGDAGYVGVNAADATYAKLRVNELARHDDIPDAHVAAILGTTDSSIIDMESARERAQTHLNDTAQKFGVTAPDINWSWVNERLSTSDPMTKTIMEITRQHLPEKPTPEDVITTFTTIASVMDLHDVAFPANNSYTQKLYSSAIKQSNGAFFHKKLQEFVTSPLKQQQAFAQLATALKNHQEEGNALSQARKSLTEDQLLALDTSNPVFEVVKNKSGNLKVRMTLDHLDGSRTKASVRDSHLISSVGATLGLNLGQVHQLNHLYQQEGPGNIPSELIEMNPMMSREEAQSIIDGLHNESMTRSAQNEDRPELLIPVQHIGNLRTGKPSMSSVLDAISAKSEISANAMIRSIADRTPHKNITGVQFSAEHGTPTILPKLNNPFEFTMHIPYAMVGKPSSYSDKTEGSIMDAQISGFVNAFAKFNSSKGSPIDVYNNVDVLKKSKNQHKRLGNERVLPLERTERDDIAPITTDTDALTAAQGKVIDAIADMSNEPFFSLSRYNNEESLARVQAILDIADTTLYGNNNLENFGDETVDLIMAAKEAPPLESLVKFTNGVLTQKEINKQIKDFGPMADGLKKLSSFAVANPSDSLSPENLSRYVNISNQIKRNVSTIQKTKEQLSKLVTERSRLDNLDEKSVGAITDLRDKQKSLELHRQESNKYLTQLEGFKEVWKEAIKSAQNADLLGDIEPNTPEYNAIVKDNFNKLKDTMGINGDKELVLRSDPKTIENAIESTVQDIKEYDSEINQIITGVRAIEKKAGVSAKVLDDFSYGMEMRTMIRKITTAATNISNRVNELSAIANDNLLAANPDINTMFEGIADGGLTKYLQPEEAQKFRELGFNIMRREGNVIKLKGPRKYQSIFESLRQQLSFYEDNPTDYILDYETQLFLEDRLQKITEAAEMLNSLNYKDADLTAEEITTLNIMARQYMEEILG